VNGGWSELAPTNALVEDEAVEAVLWMNKKSHPPCPHGFFFSTSSLPQNFPPSYLPPTNPSPLHSIARAPETLSGSELGAGAGAVGACAWSLEEAPGAWNSTSSQSGTYAL